MRERLNKNKKKKQMLEVIPPRLDEVWKNRSTEGGSLLVARTSRNIRRRKIYYNRIEK